MQHHWAVNKCGSDCVSKGRYFSPGSPLYVLVLNDLVEFSEKKKRRMIKCVLPSKRLANFDEFPKSYAATETR